MKRPGPTNRRFAPRRWFDSVRRLGCQDSNCKLPTRSSLQVRERGTAANPLLFASIFNEIRISAERHVRIPFTSCHAARRHSITSSARASSDGGTVRLTREAPAAAVNGSNPLGRARIGMQRVCRSGAEGAGVALSGRHFLRGRHRDFKVGSC